MEKFVTPVGRLPYKKGRILIMPFWGEKRVVVPFGMFIHKRSTAGVFSIPFRVLSGKHMTVDNVVLEVPCFRPMVLLILMKM